MLDRVYIKVKYENISLFLKFPFNRLFCLIKEGRVIWTIFYFSTCCLKVFFFSTIPGDPGPQGEAAWPAGLQGGTSPQAAVPGGGATRRSLLRLLPEGAAPHQEERLVPLGLCRAAE